MLESMLLWYPSMAMREDIYKNIFSTKKIVHIGKSDTPQTKGLILNTKQLVQYI